MAQIVNDRRANVSRKWQSFKSLAFATYENLTFPPVQIVQGHGEHFSAAQTESRQKQHDGVVALPRSRVAITALDQSLDVFG